HRLLLCTYGICEWDFLPRRAIGEHQELSLLGSYSHAGRPNHASTVRQILFRFEKLRINVHLRRRVPAGMRSWGRVSWGCGHVPSQALHASLLSTRRWPRRASAQLERPLAQAVGEGAVVGTREKLSLPNSLPSKQMRWRQRANTGAAIFIMR